MLLLLAMQYHCNRLGLAVPYEDIGATVGPGVTPGAIVQHLAKLRARMVAEGHRVPPPLKRGGSTSKLGAGSLSSKAKAAKKGNAKGDPKDKAIAAKSTPAMSKKAGKRAAPGSDDSDDDDESWNDDESDMEYGESRAKRAKYDAKGGMLRRKTKTAHSDEEVATRPGARELSAYGETDINGVPIDYGSDGEKEVGASSVGTNATWLDLDDDYASHPKTGKKTCFKKQSLVVSLATASQNTGAMAAIKEEDDDTGDMSELESEDELVGGGVEDCVDESHVHSNEELENMFGAMNDEDFDDSQLEAILGSANPNGLYNNPYQADPQLMTFNGEVHQPRPDIRHARSAFQPYDARFENDALAAEQAKEHFTGFESKVGGNFAFGQTSTNFNHQANRGYGTNNGAFDAGFGHNGGLDTMSFGNGGMFNGTAQQDAFAHQAGNSYGASANVFGDNIGGSPFTHGRNHHQSNTHQIQTSWPNTYGSVEASANTSVNQTPVAMSAGADLGTGYFSNGPFDLGADDNTFINYSGDNGANEGFDTTQFDDKFIGGGSYPNGHYGF